MSDLMIPDFKGAIFDLDGTLLDSMGIWEQIDIDFLKKRGHAATADYIQDVTPMSFEEAADYTIRRFGLAETARDLLDEWNLMCREAYQHTVSLKPAVNNYLQHLKKSGVKIGAATALSPDLFQPALENCGVLHLFDTFASLDEVQRGKGFPDIYLLAAERLNMAPADCLVFEDIFLGISGAKSGGFLTCGVFDSYAAHEWEKIRQTADLSIKNFTELFF